jgi:hypothetical protein
MFSLGGEKTPTGQREAATLVAARKLTATALRLGDFVSQNDPNCLALTFRSGITAH